MSWPLRQSRSQGSFRIDPSQNFRCSGDLTVKVVPASRSVRTSSWPPICATTRLRIARRHGCARAHATSMVQTRYVARARRRSAGALRRSRPATWCAESRRVARPVSESGSIPGLSSCSLFSSTRRQSASALVANAVGTEIRSASSSAPFRTGTHFFLPPTLALSFRPSVSNKVPNPVRLSYTSSILHLSAAT